MTARTASRRTEAGTSALTEAILSHIGKRGTDRMLAEFARLLYVRGVQEDLAAYRPEELAAVAREAFAFLRERTPGRHKIHIYNPDGPAGGKLSEVTIVEIANDDMPFLLDSTLGLLNEQGLTIELVVHPILAAERTADGTLTSLGDGATAAVGVPRESFIHVHIARLAHKEDMKRLEAQLKSVLKDVRTVVLDWRPMMDRLTKAIDHYQANPPPVAVEELAESIQFLQWLLDNHFTFLGMREYAFSGDGPKAPLAAVKGSGLGLLRDPDVQVLRRGSELVDVTPEVLQFLKEPAPLIITKANVRATVHRRAYMDYIGIKRFDRDGRLVGELRVVGLFTSGAYTRSVRYIPLVRRKIARIIEQSGFKPDSHSGKALLNILETFPRDEVFQVGARTLSKFAIGILQLEERPRTRLFVRRDKFDRFVSAFTYIPRDRFNTDVRLRIGELLAEAYDGHVSAFYPAFPEGTLVRVHFIIGRREGETPEPNLAELEAAIVEIVRTWDDRLADAISERLSPQAARRALERYRGAFSGGYQEAYPPSQAVDDIAHMERLHDAGDIAVSLQRGPSDGPETVRLKLFHLGAPIPLSDRLPILHSMGFRSINERTHRISRAGESGHDLVVLHEVRLSALAGGPIDLDALGDFVIEGFLAVWDGKAENDRFNGLVLLEGLAWRDAALLRACGKYLRQAAVPFSVDDMAATLNKYPKIARMLRDLFHVRFDPHSRHGNDGGTRETERILAEIDTHLADVPSLDEDRIIRRFVNLVMAMIRANFFQRTGDGAPRPTISFKIDSRKVEGLPEPRPFAEIFVYAPDVEGVHLRGGRIARGGLRWSDRPADFRTEVLGLQKAQNVKNAVIVPVGAKGGFVCKRLPQGGSREEIRAEGVRCYRLFVSSLLDITDTLVGDAVVHPEDVLRHDDDDPYLVVAADKGTADFSDIANEISESHGFWLGDAFASGGSAGYDHKKMAITARGAWEAVKRHFREMDMDIQSTPFTVMGVGDMSGDVFGNGMLLSKCIRLVAAFDHRDIFIDPDPDPETSWAERRRLFDLPRSSWQDYSRELISKGGGVFSRQAKAVPLSEEVRALTGLTGRSATPAELMKALLMAPVDLIWFGGIGTYVRASEETDGDVGDRANDAIRVSAAQLSAKVIGEGANLGVTQRGRVEFALNGGRVNTDAVDNSAGVNSSDYEVNIKIALGAAEQADTLKRPARNRLLAQMTDEVADLVLRNNYLQTLCLTLAQARSVEELSFHTRLMRWLERRGLLDRALEYLPDDRALAARQSQGRGLTRPELAVLMSYAKIVLFDQILDSGVPDDPYLGRELHRYFPERLNRKFANEIKGHRLRREIIATMLANSMINRGGPAFVFRLEEEVGAGVASIAAAYAVARDAFGFTELNGMLDALDNRIPAVVQTGIYLELQLLLRRLTMWFLRNETLDGGLDALVGHYRQGLDRLAAALPEALPEEARPGFEGTMSGLAEAGLPAEAATRVGCLRYLWRGPDMVLVATLSKRPLEAVARVFFTLGSRLGIDQLVTRASEMHVADYYDRMAINRTLDDVFATHRALALDMLAQAEDAAEPWEAWLLRHAEAIERTTTAIGEAVSGEMTLARLAVMASLLKDLEQATGGG